MFRWLSYLPHLVHTALESNRDYKWCSSSSSVVLADSSAPWRSVLPGPAADAPSAVSHSACPWLQSPGSRLSARRRLCSDAHADHTQADTCTSQTDRQTDTHRETDTCTSHRQTHTHTHRHMYITHTQTINNKWMTVDLEMKSNKACGWRTVITFTVWPNSH